ncbi:MAG: HDOD domain-containing protein [Gammaproteobacteria bacterium]|nr:HDOD domain-containing protein [Gammaproteobacteria bacterium]
MATQKRIEIMDYGGFNNIDLLVAEVEKLVSLPDVYYRLEALIENPTATVSDFSNVLAGDPDLCARLLSLANSAFYSFPASIETVDKAVHIIGIRQIRELVLATSIIRVFTRMPLGMINMHSFWEHSVAVGVMAKSIGQYCHISQPERFYVAGLLHDIGRLVFYIKMPGLMHELLLQREAKEEFLYLLEQENLAYSHAEVGGRLLENWRVPASIHEPVSCHHKPAESLEFTQVTAAVHIADVWVNKHQVGTSGERFSLTISDFALEQLNLQHYELDEIGVLAEEAMKDVVTQFMSQ